VEVKRGDWIQLDECANEGVYCSVCHKKVYKIEYANQALKSAYCPNCGANMRGAK
jgi:predicted amidophosphoribosyltransferase